MHVQYLYTLDFLEYEMFPLENAVREYKALCEARMKQGNVRAGVEREHMERLEKKILNAKRKAHDSVERWLEQRSKSEAQTEKS